MAQTIRIAIDLDGVLTEHPAPLARAANEQFGLELAESAFVDSAGHYVPDDVRLWVYGADGPASKLVLAERAIDFLKRLTDRLGPENVVIITARPEGSKEMTEQWLGRNGLDLAHVVYADDKVQVASDLGVTHAVEDSVRHARAYQEAGIAVFLLNDPLSAAPDDISTTVASLDDILQQLETDATVTTPTTTERPTIVISDVIDPDAHAALAAAGEVVDIDGTDQTALFEAVATADALVVRSETQVTAELLQHGTNLKVVARAGVGVDNIQVDAATEAGIMVLNAPGANSVSAGEHTIALMLALARQIADANVSMHAGKWERKRFKLFDLRGKTVGIVGLGRVGRVVAQRLKAFEARVVAHDPYIGPDRFRELDVERVSYNELLATSDVVTYHVPLTDETENYLSREALNLMKSGAIIVNAARGEVVDQEALAEALDSGKLAGAAVDVFPEEPLTWSPLWGKPNVVLTPHLGGSSREAQAAVGDIISWSTLAALRGEAVPNAVNLPAVEIEPDVSRRLNGAAAAAGHLLSVLEPELPRSFSMTATGNLSDELGELVFTTALAEGLRRWAPGRVSPVNARMIAASHDIEQHLSRYSVPDSSVIEFAFEVTNDSAHNVTVRWDADQIGIMEVNRFSLGQPLAGDVLITHHQDIPGIVGEVGMILGRHNVNIAGMQLGRHDRGGEAMMVLNVDTAIPPAVLDDILATPAITNAYVVSLPAVE